MKAHGMTLENASGSQGLVRSSTSCDALYEDVGPDAGTRAMGIALGILTPATLAFWTFVVVALRW
jgi:hypothetical protein